VTKQDLREVVMHGDRVPTAIMFGRASGRVTTTGSTLHDVPPNIQPYLTQTVHRLRRQTPSPRSLTT